MFGSADAAAAPAAFAGGDCEHIGGGLFAGGTQPSEFLDQLLP